MEEDKKGQAAKSGGESGKKNTLAKDEDTDSKRVQSDTGTPAATGRKSSPSDDQSRSESKSGSASEKKEPPKITNRLREYRIDRMMSKAELARKAGLSVLTVARIEKGFGCRMDTKRKILKALGLKLSDRSKVFEDV
jgi:DNA-binding XRE family transcriptional regulator